MKELTYLTLSEQVYEDIIKNINEGVYTPGNTIPGENKLCEIYGVSRVTVRNAIDKLVANGFLIKRKGKGTFVKHKQTVVDMFANGSFTENCKLLGVNPSTAIIYKGYEDADKSLAKVLGGDDNKVVIIKRVRYIDDDPCIVELDFFSKEYNFLLNDDLENKSLIEHLNKKSNKQPTTFIDKYTIVEANKEYANLLNCKVGMPLLEVDQQVFAEDDSLIYLNKQYIVTNNYIYAVKSTNKQCTIVIF